jgi:hypothetical protein
MSITLEIEDDEANGTNIKARCQEGDVLLQAWAETPIRVL